MEIVSRGSASARPSSLRAVLGLACAVSLGLPCGARTLVQGTPDRLLHARLEFPTIGGGKPTGLLAADLDLDGKSEIVVVTSAPATLQVWSGMSRVMLGWPEPRALPIDDFALGPVWLGGGMPASREAPAEVVIASRATRRIQVVDARAAWRSPKDADLAQFTRFSVTLEKRPRVLASGRLADGTPVIAAITIDEKLAIVRGPTEVVITALTEPLATCAAFDGDGRSLFVGFQGTRKVMRFALDASGRATAGGACELSGLPRHLLVAPPRQQGVAGVLAAGGDSSVWLLGGEEGPHVLGTYEAGTVPIALAWGRILGREMFASIALEGQEVVLWDAIAKTPPAAPVRTYAGQRPLAGAIGDFDGDGHGDVAIANGDAQRIGIVFSRNDEALDVARASKLGRQAISLAAGDLDGDRQLDVVSISKIEGTLAVSRNLGGCALSDHRVQGRADGGNALRLADLDGDGALDVAFLRRVGRDRTLLDAYFGDGHGSLFQRAAVLPVEIGASGSDLLCTDLDGDGRVEALITDPEGGRVVLVDVERVPEAGVRFGAPRALAVASGPCELSLLDVEGDAKPEIAVALGGPGPRLGVAFLRAKRSAEGALVLEEIRALPCSAPVTALAAADNDQDGLADLVLLVSRSDSDNHLECWYQAQDRTWKKADEDLPTGLRPYALRMADLDGDSIADIVCTAQNSHHVNVWLNGGGTPIHFARLADLGVGAGPLDVQLADLDADGALEVVVANGFSNDLSVVRLR